MTHMTLENSSWECGCQREDDASFKCDGTCRLNKEWTLRRAQGAFSVLGSIVAVLSHGTTAGLSTYTFKWSDDNVILAIFHSSDPTLTDPFTTGAESMTLD